MADSGLITRGRTYETLRLSAPGVAEENLSLVDEVQHLFRKLEQSDHFPSLPYDGPINPTPVRAEFGLAVYLAESAALLRSPPDLTPEALRSAGFQHEVCYHGNDNGDVLVKILPQ